MTRPLRRAALLAVFDPDGLVDEALLQLVRELGRHADVFVLHDGYLPPEELAKLRDLASGAWAIRHGAYDFGSYAMLATRLVGWEALAAYDEVLLVNDSCYLVRPLDEVLATMADRDCDWWGLQATKGIAATRDAPSNAFTQPIPMDVVREELLARFEEDEVYDFLLGSYFLALRRPVLDDPAFRSFLASVRPQDDKLRVVLDYEVGLTRLLIGQGHRFDTFVPDLHPFHPIFSENQFRLIAAGFPLLKRYLLAHNHYDVPDLAAWRERLLEVAPDAPVDVIEANLRRTAPDDRLRRSFAITRAPDGSVVVPKPLRGRRFVEQDEQTAKDPDRWVLAVDPDTHRLPDSARALLEAVRVDPAVRPVVLTRSRRLDLGPGVLVTPVSSPEGREALLTAGVVVVPAEPRRALNVPVTLAGRTVVAVRDGLQLEPAGAMLAPPTAPPTFDPREDRPPLFLRAEPTPTVSAVLAASRVDQLAALATWLGVPYDRAWRTGLPAHDFLLMPEERLPADFRLQLDRLREQLAGRRLVLVAPGARRTRAVPTPDPLDGDGVAALAAWAERADAVLGVREPVGDRERPYSRALDGVALDLSPHRHPALPPVLRAADVLVTDHSGLGLDFLVTGRPVVGFAPDREPGVPAAEASLDPILDPGHLLPGPVCRDAASLVQALEQAIEPGATPSPHYARVRDLLLDRVDVDSTARVLARLDAIRGRSR